jgi:hypothetical protein
LHVGLDTPVIAQASSGVDLHVYPACDQITCDIDDANYRNVSNTVEWTAASGVEYLLLVTSSVFSSDATTPEFELQVFEKEQQYRAFFAKQVSELVYSNRGTSHDLALHWIVNEDPLQLYIDDSARILQRYVMVLFYYSTSNNTLSPWRSCGPAVEGEDDSCVSLQFTRVADGSIEYVEQPGKKRWLSGTHECEWEGIVCGHHGEDDVQGIKICE